MNVANIMPGDVVETELVYSELIVPEEGTYTFRPGTGPRREPARTVHDLAIGLMRSAALGWLLFGSIGFALGCAGQAPGRDASSPPAASGSPPVASSSPPAASSSSVAPASAPAVPLLPYPAEPFDPEAVRALRQRLTQVAARVAPGARPAAPDIAGKLAAGQRLEQSYPVREGCYIAVAVVETGGITELGLELTDLAAPDHSRTDTSTTQTALIGAPSDCVRVSASSELRVAISAVSGAGLAAAQLYVR